MQQSISYGEKKKKFLEGKLTNTPHFTRQQLSLCRLLALDGLLVDLLVNELLHLYPEQHSAIGRQGPDVRQQTHQEVIVIIEAIALEGIDAGQADATVAVAHKDLLRRDVLQHHFIFCEIVSDVLKLQVVEALLGFPLHVHRATPAVMIAVQFQLMMTDVTVTGHRQQMIGDRVPIVETAVDAGCRILGLALARL